MDSNDGMTVAKGSKDEETAATPNNLTPPKNSEERNSRSHVFELYENTEAETAVRIGHERPFPNINNEQLPSKSTDFRQYRSSQNSTPRNLGSDAKSTKKRTNNRAIKIMAAILACVVVVGCLAQGGHLWAEHHPTIIDGIYDISDVPSENRALLKRAFHKALPLGAGKYSSGLLKTETAGSYFNVTKTLGAREEYAYKDNTLWGVEQNNIYILRHGSIDFYSYSPTLDSLSKDENGTPLKDYGGLLNQNGVKEFRLQAAKLTYKCALFELSTYLSNIAAGSDYSIITASDVSSVTQDMTDKINVKINKKGDPEGSYDKVFRTENHYINISLRLKDDMPVGAVNIVDENAKQSKNTIMPGNHPFPDKTIESVPKAASNESTDPEGDREMRRGEPMDEQEYRASQYNPKTAVSKAYWSCTPQSRMPHFDFELTEHEHKLYMSGTRDWTDGSLNKNTVTCITDSLGLPTQEINGYIEKSFNENSPANTLKYQNYSLIWELSDTDMTFTVQD